MPKQKAGLHFGLAKAQALGLPFAGKGREGGQGLALGGFGNLMRAEQGKRGRDKPRMPRGCDRGRNPNQPPGPAFGCFNQQAFSSKGAFCRIKPTDFLCAGADARKPQRRQNGKALKPRCLSDRERKF
jgi:hypothetical protein